MNLWKKIRIIIFITFGLITMSSQSEGLDAAGKMKLLRDTVGKRLYVPIPQSDGGWIDATLDRNRVIDSKKLSQAIVDELDDIAKVYDISFGPLEDTWGEDDDIYFDAIFKVETTEGVVHSRIRCSSTARWFALRLSSARLIMQDCGNSDVVFGNTRIVIPLSAIRYEAPKKEETRKTLN